MSNSRNEYIIHDMLLRRDLFGEVREGLQSTSGELKNKYLYLGPYGAMAWAVVERKLDIKTNAKKMLEDCVGEILNILRDDNKGEGLDIVSLGSGTGGDDEYILEELLSKGEENVHVYLIDISIDLLRIASKKIIDIIVNYDNTELHPICVDFENLQDVKLKYFKKRDSRQRLFHLLGLTLGNNDEISLLANISKGMELNDYLLIAVDLCLDSSRLQKESISSYDKINHEVKIFLSGPLITGISIYREKRVNLHDVRFKGDIGMACGAIYDYMSLADGNAIISTKIMENEKQAKKYSSIKNALSIARYYEYKQKDCQHDVLFDDEYGKLKLCDYSNKYSSECFYEFLTQEVARLGLVPVKINKESDLRQWQNGSQTLILLKKVHASDSEELQDHLKKMEVVKEYETIKRTLSKINDKQSKTGGRQIAREAVTLIEKISNIIDSNSIEMDEVDLDEIKRINIHIDCYDKKKTTQYCDEIKKILEKL